MPSDKLKRLINESFSSEEERELFFNDLDLSNIGQAVRIIRKRTGLSIRQFAIEVKMSYANLCDIENGHLNPTLPMVKRITDACNLVMYWECEGVE